MTDLKPPLEGYSLWLEAGDDEQRFLQSLVDELVRDYRMRGFGAHATLIGLLEKRKADLASIEKACTVLAGSYRPAATEVVGIGIRNAYFQSVFLVIAPTNDLVAMNRRARELLGHEHDPPFMPHWSAVYGDLGWQTKKSIVYDLMATMKFPMPVTIRSLALVDVEGYPDEWKIIARYPLADSVADAHEGVPT